MTGDTSIDLAIGGTALPFLISIINQSHWSAKIRGAVAFLLCLGAGAGLAAWHGTLNLADWRTSAITVTGASMVMYHALWKPSGIAPAIENATSVRPADDTADGPERADDVPPVSTQPLGWPTAVTTGTTAFTPAAPYLPPTFQVPAVPAAAPADAGDDDPVIPEPTWPDAAPDTDPAVAAPVPPADFDPSAPGAFDDVIADYLIRNGYYKAS